jgi:hypothetical protein
VVFEDGETDELSLSEVQKFLENSRVPFAQSLLCMKHHVRLHEQAEDNSTGINSNNNSCGESNNTSKRSDRRRRNID